MRSKEQILIDIELCRNIQIGSLQIISSLEDSIVMHQKSIGVSEFQISRRTIEIEKLEQELWWSNLIELCTTPCWRYRLSGRVLK